MVDGVTFTCTSCEISVCICSSCWRGQRYCSEDCRRHRQLELQCARQKRYAKTGLGRESQRRRDRRRRVKKTPLTLVQMNLRLTYIRVSKFYGLSGPSAVGFTGNAGLGKTHLARALGYGACQKGICVLFISVAEMVNHLAHAQKTFNLELELKKYRRPQVLIPDELGYVSLDTQASNLFFQVISSRHDKELVTIATTNLPFGKFNQIFANDAIAHAIIDRLVNNAEVFFMEGDSYRPHQRKEKLKKKKIVN